MNGVSAIAPSASPAESVTVSPSTRREPLLLGAKRLALRFERRDARAERRDLRAGGGALAAAHGQQREKRDGGKSWAHALE